MLPEGDGQLGLLVNLACLPLLNKVFAGLDIASKYRSPTSQGVYELVIEEASVEE